MNEKLDNLIEVLQTLTLKEASQLVSKMENVFGIDTSISVQTSQGTPVTNVISAPEAIEEQNVFTIVLNEVPTVKKMAILKIVRTITGLGLKESKDIVDNVPKVLKEGVTKEESDKIKKELEEAGATVVLQ